MSHPDLTPIIDFKHPPVVEVALSVQFEPLALQIPHLGLFWSYIRTRYPKIEVHSPLAPQIEQFDKQTLLHGGIQFSISQGIDTPRCWYLTASGDELIQIQSDRVIFNWKKVNHEHEYKHYEYIRKKFIEEYSIFLDFVSENQLGTIRPLQCEVTYVNHLLQGEGIDSLGQLERVFTFWHAKYNDAFLPEVDTVNLASRYIIRDNQGNPLGRLHIAVDPKLRRQDRKPLLGLTLTARGQPLDLARDPIVNFFDLGREWIVNAFKSITTPTIQNKWERTK